MVSTQPVKDIIRHKFQINFLKKWLKFSWIPMYPTIGHFLILIDVTVFTMITNSVIGLAFWGAAMVIAKLVESSGTFSGPVYSKLLQDKDHTYVNDNLNYFIYFGVLFTAISIVFAKPGLYILNPIYEIMSPIVLILAIKIFFQTLTSINLTFLVGKDNTDINQNASFKDYIRSKFFFTPTIIFIHAATYIISLVIVLRYLTSYIDDDIELLFYWALIALIVQIPFSLFVIYYLKREYKIVLDKIRILKYILSVTSIFSIIYFIMEKTIIYENNIYKFFPTIVLWALLGIGSYVIITYLIDSKISLLIKEMVNEIFKK